MLSSTDTHSFCIDTWRRSGICLQQSSCTLNVVPALSAPKGQLVEAPLGRCARHRRCIRQGGSLVSAAARSAAIRTAYCAFNAVDFEGNFAGCLVGLMSSVSACTASRSGGGLRANLRRNLHICEQPCGQASVNFLRQTIKTSEGMPYIDDGFAHGDAKPKRRQSSRCAPVGAFGYGAHLSLYSALALEPYLRMITIRTVSNSSRRIPSALAHCPTNAIRTSRLPRLLERL